MFWIALAAQVSAFYTNDPKTVFSPDDMPAYVQIAGINRIVGIRTTVRSDGTVRDCRIERASGDANLDRLTCQILVQRAKFEAAKWIDGSPAYGVYRVPITWAIGEPPSAREHYLASPPDMEIEVAKLPPGVPSPFHVQLLIAVDTTGKVSACDEAPKSVLDHERHYPVLVQAACGQMATKFTAIPPKDEKGVPVRSVQSAFVAFTSAH